MAFELARRLDGEIVNADSMQVYRVPRILTARPDDCDLARVSHHLYGHVPPDMAYSVGRWLEDVARVVEDIRIRGKLPILVGGTGLYFRAFLGGLSNIPPISPRRRNYWRLRLEAFGSAALHAELFECDPHMARRLAPADGVRILRALEVFDETGRSIVEFQKPTGRAVIEPGKTIKIIVMPEREKVYAQIGMRFRAMLENGALEEVESLIALDLDPTLPVTKVIGLRELKSYLDGALKREDAIGSAIAHTRQYAKRQMSWMRNQFDDSWFMGDVKTLFDVLEPSFRTLSEQ